MSALLMNRDGFVMPADGFYQIAPAGEFAHAGAGVVQVVDAEACETMVKRFVEEAGVPNFAGLLVDFDHFSLDGEKRSEAAGWIVGLEARPTGQRAVGSGLLGDAESRSGAGLWAKIRWSDLGEAAVKGGRYRFLSPVWSRGDCVDLGNGRVRPVRLLNAAVTNDPNLKGIRPLSNRSQGSGFGVQEGEPRMNANGRESDGGGVANRDGVGSRKDAKAAKEEKEGRQELANAGEKNAKRYKWVLGENDRHCPSCAAMGGKVHTMAEWDAAGVKPGSGGLYCQGSCHCKLVETEEASTGAVAPGPMRKKKEEDVMNRSHETDDRKSKSGKEPRMNTDGSGGVILANYWSDEAREASLAVRRASAKQRSEAKAEEKKERDAATKKRQADAYRERYGHDPESDAEWAEAAVLDRDRRLKRALGNRGAVGEPEGSGLEVGDGENARRHCLLNTWSDEARAAARAVRRAKAAARKPPEGRDTAAPPPAQVQLPQDSGRMYPGGTPWFDEKTGQYVVPVPPWWLPTGMVPPGGGKTGGVAPGGGAPGRPRMPGPGQPVRRPLGWRG